MDRIQKVATRVSARLRSSQRFDVDFDRRDLVAARSEVAGEWCEARRGMAKEGSEVCLVVEDVRERAVGSPYYLRCGFVGE